MNTEKLILRYNSITNLSDREEANANSWHERLISEHQTHLCPTNYSPRRKTKFYTSPPVGGAVAIAYNLPGKPQLNLDPETLADIFLGKITKWDHQRIKQLNPDVTLPSMDLVVVHRSDGSGTTFIFTDYLSVVNKEWAEKVGRGTSVKWPTGLGAKRQ